MKRVLTLFLFVILAACKPPTTEESKTASTPSPSPIPEATSTPQTYLPADYYVGVWKGQDEYQDGFNIIIVSDGRAISNWSNSRNGGRGERGQWRMIGNDLLIFYRNGWTDHFIKDGDSFRSLGFSPGTNLQEDPADESPVSRVDGELAIYSGVWRLNAEPDGNYLYISLQSDGDAESTNSSNGTGKWELTPQGAKVVWADGWTDIISRVGENFSRLSWAPGAAVSEPPTDTSEAFKVGSVPARVAP